MARPASFASIGKEGSAMPGLPRLLIRVLLVLPLLAATACGDLNTSVDAPLGPDGEVRFGRAPVLPFSEALAELGDLIFDDENLSLNRNQSCNSCHTAEWGFTGPNSDVNATTAVYEGSIPGRWGERKPPSSAYSTPAPVFHYTRQAGGMFVGGNFWDGRATGDRLGNAAAEQAQGPFLNPVEQALRDEACVVYRVAHAEYAGLYTELWGTNIQTIVFPADIDALCASEGPRLDIDAVNRARIAEEYDNIAISIAVYEESHNLFSSKFDAARKGLYKFTREEQHGLALFQGTAKCAKCHVSNGQDPLFTDFSYDNLGVPANPDNPVYASNPDFTDLGLGGFLLHTGWASYAPGEIGKMKVPTLRNVDLRPWDDAVKSYMHNGVFRSLAEVVRFYNTRDVLPRCGPGEARAEWGESCWPAPEVAQNMNTKELGDLGLSSAEEAAIVAFLKTLSDGYLPGTRGRHFR
jgi:cytochrome c peroxidase